MANKVSVLIDVTVDKANRALAGFRKSVSDADGAVGKFKAGSASAFASLKANAVPVAAAAGAAVVTFAAKAVGAASDLQESSNAVTKVFGETAEAVLAVGENAAESFGMSRTEFNQAAVAFSSFAKEVAGPGGDVAAVIEEMTGRASDFASVMNISVAEAATVFRSGLSGETEPLKKFGINLSAAAVEAHALAVGMVSSKSEMTEAIKVQARYELLLERTNDVAGDFADTSDGLANSTRIAGSRMTDFQARVGEGLIPAVETAVGAAMDLADAMDAIKLSAGGAGESLSDERGFIDGVTNAIENQLNPAQRLAQTYNFLNAGWDDLFGSGEEAAETVHSLSQELVQGSIDAAMAERVTTDLADAQADSATRTADHRAAQERLGRSVRDSTAAIDENIEATQEAIDKRNQFANATWDAEDAEDAFQDAVETMTATLEEHGAETREGSASVRDAARATDEMVRKQLEAEGVILDSARGQEIYKGKLQDVANYMGGPLGNEIRAHVDRLDGIPDGVVTTVTAEMQGISATRARIESILGRRISIPVNTYTTSSTRTSGTYSHDGSIVGGRSFKGLADDDVPMILQKGQAVLTEGQQEAVLEAGAVSGGTGGGGGGSTFNVTINADPNPDVTVRKLREWVRRNGPLQGVV